MNKKFNFSDYFIILIVLIIINIIKNEKLLYPSILTLLNQELILVVNNGIHFYDSNLENEDLDKLFPLNITSPEENYKTAMAQFSEDNGGYILILVKNIMYIFQHNGTIVFSSDFSNYLNGTYYCITPYKRKNNKLHYVISYSDLVNKIILIYFIFDLDSKENSYQVLNFDVRVQASNSEPSKLEGVTCLLILDSTNNEVLTCFYACHFPVEIQSRSFDPNNNFNEITGMFKYISFDSNEYSSIPPFISAVTNLEKNKVLICFVFSSHNWLSFDFENNFSNVTNNDNSGILGFYPYNEMIYFQQTHEIAIISKINSCTAYVLIFNDNFSLKNKGTFKPDGCYNSNFFSIYYNGINYVIVTDSTNSNDNNLFNMSLIDFDPIIIDDSVDISTENILISSSNVLEEDDTSSTSDLEEDNTTPIENYSNNIKCYTSTRESSLYNLCTYCNNEKGYFQVETSDNTLFHGFVECYNNDSKPINFYYNSTINKFKICYETCLTCNGDGDEFNNNCLTCDINHVKKSDYPKENNCIAKCPYFYYYTSYGQYKCTNNTNCPENENLYIKELKKCTNNCSKEEKYKYQYGGRCLESCPENTNPNPNNKCIEEIESCSISENEIDISDILVSNYIDSNAKSYAKEFGYTKKHISFFYNSEYKIILYKDLNCIYKLNIKITKVDFQECYSKVKESIKPIEEELIIGLVERLYNQKNSQISYYFYHPITGEKLDVDTICKEEEIIIKKDVISQLNSSTNNLYSLLLLTEQNINIFDLSSKIYTDICYHFETPNGKDIPLSERIHLFYPNITLCEKECINIGVNLTSMESICECKYNNILNNEFFEDNAIVDEIFGDINDIISNSNLDVLKCYKDVFNIKYMRICYGGFIIIGIIIIDIIFTIIFKFYDMELIQRYIFNISEKYISLFVKEKNDTKHREEDKNKTIIKHKSNKINEPTRKKNTKKNSKVSLDVIKNEEKSSKTLHFNKSNISLIKRQFSFNGSKSVKNIQKRKNKKIGGTIINNEKNYIHIYINSFDMDEYLKTDLDDMEYDEAIRKDKRTFSNFLCDRIKDKQIIINTFFIKDNIKPLSIKILFFLLNIDLYFVINGLFFSEEYIIELYHMDKKDNFFSYMPRSYNRFTYATLVSTIVGIIIDCIFVEEKRIKRIFLRGKNDALQLRYEIANIIKSIKKRYISFIFICFSISIISWYYVSCFNSVYKNVKIEWIKSSITVIFIIQLLSIIICFVEALLREISFKFKSEKVFKLIQILS